MTLLPTNLDNVHDENTNSNEVKLAVIWQDVLGLSEPPGKDEDFFDLGGDSLLAIQTVDRISSTFGKSIKLQDFFFNPSISLFSEFLNQEQQPTPRASWRLPLEIFKQISTFVGSWRAPPTVTEVTQPKPTQSAPWGLPLEIFKQISTFVGSWQGDRISSDSLIVGRNTTGTQPPLFWVFQGEHEFLQLGSCLDKDQPIFGMRSGNVVMDYTENNIQALALNYVNGIEKERPEGPLIIGGNCQGAIIALAVAQHLQRRKRHIPTLILMEWVFGPEPYSGPVTLIFGRKSHHNPWQQFRHPELAWRRAFNDYSVEITQGAHGNFFEESNVQALAAIITRCMKQAMDITPQLLPSEAKSIGLEVLNPPTQLLRGTQALIHVRVTNRSRVHWSSGDYSGLMLVNHWLQQKNKILQKKDGHIALPALAPDASCELYLPVTAPQHTGETTLVVRAVEEGVGWFDIDGGTVRCTLQLEAPEPGDQ